MTTRRDHLKNDLLKHYGEKTPHAFFQVDAFQVDPFGIDGGDSTEPILSYQATYELMSGGPNVRVLLTPETDQRTALRLLKRIRNYLKNPSTFSQLQDCLAANENDLGKEICSRCGYIGPHHTLCSSRLPDEMVRQAIAHLRENGEFPF